MEKPRVRAAGILIKDGKILLIRHQKGKNSYWLLPGGGVDYGETMEASLKREFLEECNIDVEIGEMAFVSQGIAPDKSRHIIHMTFEVEYTGGELQVGDEGILKEVSFLPVEELDKVTLYPNMKRELKEYFSGKKELRYLGNRWE